MMAGRFVIPGGNQEVRQDQPRLSRLGVVLARRLTDTDRLAGTIVRHVVADELHPRLQRLTARFNRPREFTLRFLWPAEMPGEDRLEDANVHTIGMLLLQLGQLGRIFREFDDRPCSTARLMPEPIRKRVSPRSLASDSALAAVS